MTSLQAADAMQFASHLVLNAGLRAKRAFRSQISLSTKGTEGEIVTDVDIAIQRDLVSLIRSVYPASEIIAEELDHPSRLTCQGVEWVIDPLDGTRNFAAGIPSWCHMASLYVDGKPIASAVFDPTSNDLITAGGGLGTYLNGVRVHCREVNTLLNAHGVCVLDRRGADSHAVDMLLGRIRSKTDWIHNHGSMTQFARLAHGAYAFGISNCGKQYDYAALPLIVTEAGGLALNANFGPFSISDGTLLCCVPGIVDQLFDSPAQDRDDDK
jgi:fructose-1,6-bisphosphatase/inositol monophosphatase family enzyme